MFKCMDCGCEFEEPKVNREYHGLEYGHEDRCYCPNCGSEDYKEGHACDICGDEAFEEDYCDNCIETAKQYINTDFLSGDYIGARRSDLIDLFQIALDKLYVEERSKK